jgi:hypothetical protein
LSVVGNFSNKAVTALLPDVIVCRWEFFEQGRDGLVSRGEFFEKLPTADNRNKAVTALLPP